MNGTFTLHLQGTARYECVDNVRSFVGEDPSGHFGILAGHEPLLTSLIFGLCRYRQRGQPWIFVALTGGILFMHDNNLMINTRHFTSNPDFDRITSDLETRLLAEETELKSVRRSLQLMEEGLLKHLWDLRGQGEI